MEKNDLKRIYMRLLIKKDFIYILIGNKIFNNVRFSLKIMMKSKFLDWKMI
jgi:hypothetical protein